MTRRIIETETAPAAIGSYSQAVQCGQTVYLSGQIPLDPATMTLVEDGAEAAIRQVLDNLSAVARSAGGTLNHIAKLNVFLVDLDDFALVNEVMAEYFEKPYPARAAIGVAALPKGARVEMDAILTLPQDG